MSSRLKERGGAGSKVIAAKPHSAASDKPLLKAPPQGKENQRSVSAGRPSFARSRPAQDPNAGIRRSTSSIPKSRFPPVIPSALRASSELRSARSRPPERGPQVQDGTLKGQGEGKLRGAVASDDCGRKGASFVGVPRREAERRSASVGRSAQIGRNSVSSGSNASISRAAGSSGRGNLLVSDSKVLKQPPLDVGGNVRLEKRESSSLSSRSNAGARGSDRDAKGRNLLSSEVMESRRLLNCAQVPEKVAVLDIAGGKVRAVPNPVVAESKSAAVVDGLKLAGDGTGVMGVKREDRLREKLALLEGKVQRIAADICKTKEMLDSNGTDASKAMLSDIQRKIMGIEKDVGNVIIGSQGEPRLNETMNGHNQNVNNKLKRDLGQDGGIANSIKVLNEEELEARFFPHQKLLKRNMVPGIQVDHPVTGDVLGNIDENPIALEFLASFGDKATNISLKNKSTHSGNVSNEMASDNGGCFGGQCVQKDSVSDHHDTNDLLAEEKPEDLEDQENKQVMLKEESDEIFRDNMFEIGHKTSTGGWFVNEGEAVLLANSDGSCTYFDVANNEEKVQYDPPPGISHNMWGDCWLIRAPGVDGCSGKYVVAASAGHTLDSGFCSWDFYKKDIQAFKFESGEHNSFTAPATSSSRMVLAPLSNIEMHRRISTHVHVAEVRQWWYRPCAYLILSTSSSQNIVSAYDVRDGALSMTWVMQNPVAAMEYSCPLQWRSRGKVIIAGTETICLWDVNSLNPQPLLSVPCNGKKVLALHVNNTDAELGGGVRQRVGSSEAEGNDGVFCTSDIIHVLDHRNPTGIGLKIPISVSNPRSVFTRGDNIIVGCTESRSISKSPSSIQSFSIRKAKLAASYPVAGSAKSHPHHSSLAQVWGNSNLVLGVSGMGLSVFDAREEGMMQWIGGDAEGVGVKEMVGPDDLYMPSFDYIGGRVLLISKDRPAMWRYLS